MEINKIKEMYFYYCCDNNGFHRDWANKYYEYKDIIVSNQDKWRKEFQLLQLDKIRSDNSIEDFKRHHNEYLLSLDSYEQLFSLLIVLEEKIYTLKDVANYYFYKDIINEISFQKSELNDNIIDYFYKNNKSRLDELYIITKKMILNDTSDNNRSIIAKVKDIFHKYNYNF